MKKLIEYKCKNCNASLHIDPFNQREVTCDFCKTNFHIEEDEMQSFGYEFEMGRIKAQEDYKKYLEELEMEKWKGLSI